MTDPIDATQAMTDAARMVAILADSAQVVTTPCGDGQLVWRRWGRPGARPVILAHGGSGSWLHWIRTIPALTPDHEVWAVDLPGLGDSAMPPHPHSPQSCGRELARGIRQLIRRGRRASLVAFSFGAHVSTHALVELQNEAEPQDWIGDFTVTGAAALGLRRPALQLPKERQNMTEAEALATYRQLLAVLMIKDPAGIDALAVHIQACNVRAARFRSRPFAPTSEIRDLLPAVRLPVRAIWGGLDQTALPPIEESYAALRSGHPELVARTIPGAGHWVMYEAAAAYNAALLELLAKA